MRKLGGIPVGADVPIGPPLTCGVPPERADEDIGPYGVQILMVRRLPEEAGEQCSPLHRLWIDGEIHRLTTSGDPARVTVGAIVYILKETQGRRNYTRSSV